MRARKQVPEWMRYVLGDFAKTPYVLQTQIDQTMRAFEKGGDKPSPASSDDDTESDRPAPVPVRVQREQDDRESKSTRHFSGLTNVSTVATETPVAAPDAMGSELQRRVFAVVRQAGFATSVLDAYPWDIQSADLFRGIVHLRGSRRAYALKRTHIPAKRVVFLRDLMRHAKEHDFDAVAPLALTRKGKPYVIRQEQVYYATRWIDGQQSNFSSSDQIRQIAHTLATFHEATRGFTPSGYRPEGEFDLERMIRQRRRDLRALLVEAEGKHDQDAFDTTLLELASALRSDADQSVDLVEQAVCRSFLAEDRRRQGVCHLDVIPGNFVYDTDKRIILLDLDLATFAPRVLDLSHLLRRSLQQLHWTSEPAYAAFLSYSSVRTIEPGEYQLIRALLRFPYRAWRLANARYRMGADLAQIDELRSYQSQEPRRQAFLHALAEEITRAGA